MGYKIKNIELIGPILMKFCNKIKPLGISFRVDVVLENKIVLILFFLNRNTRYFHGDEQIARLIIGTKSNCFDVCEPTIFRKGFLGIIFIFSVLNIGKNFIDIFAELYLRTEQFVSRQEQTS